MLVMKGTSVSSRSGISIGGGLSAWPRPGKSIKILLLRRLDIFGQRKKAGFGAHLGGNIPAELNGKHVTSGTGLDLGERSLRTNAEVRLPFYVVVPRGALAEASAPPRVYLHLIPESIWVVVKAAVLALLDRVGVVPAAVSEEEKTGKIEKKGKEEVE